MNDAHEIAWGRPGGTPRRRPLSPVAGRGPLVLVVTAVAALAARPAPGQDALGSGDALDANPGRTSGGRNQAVLEEDFDARNLLITRNVLGGRGFRGSVGYSAPGDFRSPLGSNRLFRFRADSQWSDVNFVNLGNTYQRLRFGQDVGLIEYRRTGHGESIRDVKQDLPSAGLLSTSTRVRLDRVTFASSITTASELAAEPVAIGSTADAEGGTYLITASPLQGVAIEPMRRHVQLLGLSSHDAARLRQDFEAGREVTRPGAPFQSSYAELFLVPGDEGADAEDAPDPPADLVQARVDPGQDPEFMRIRERIAAGDAERADGAAAPEPRLLAGLDEQMQTLRDRLTGRGPSEPGPGATWREGTIRIGIGTDEDDEPSGDEEDEDAEDGPRRPGELGIILRHGERIEQLAGRDEGRFNELLASGEQRLRDGEYFWAERHFSRALRFTPGHPLATAGLAHAQLGAGLYLSAATTLRSLFSLQPEMIDVRYDEGLVPNRVRLLGAAQTLQERLEETRDRVPTAFLLAYVGRLLDDRALVEQGLTVMTEEMPDDPLPALLQSVWLVADEG